MRGERRRAAHNYDSPQRTDAIDGFSPLQQEWQQQQQVEKQALINRSQQTQIIKQPSLNNSIVDIKYASGSGDVVFRSFEYDQNTKQLSRMYSLSTDPKRGYQIWNSIGNGRMHLQGTNQIITNVSLDQKTGLFSYYSPQNQRFHTHNARGERDKPDDLQKAQLGIAFHKQANDSSDKTRQQIAQSYGEREISTNKDSYGKNLRIAAADGKPVVMTIGDSRDPRCKELIENINKTKQNPSSNRAHFIFIDIAKFTSEKGNSIGNYARANMLKYSGRPLTTVFTQTPGNDGILKPDAPVHHQVGYEINTETLLAAVKSSDRKSREQQQKPAPPTEKIPAPIRPDSIESDAIQIKGDVSNAFVAEVLLARMRIPQHLRNQVEKAGYKILLGSKFRDIDPKTAGDRPRGWPPGSSHNNLEGWHNETSKIVGIVEHRLDKDKWVKSDRIGGVFRHEFGHAVNVVWGKNGAKFSDSPEFQVAYERDINNMNPEQRQNKAFDYFRLKDGAGKSELFADVFALLMGGAANNNENEIIAAAFPEVAKLIRKKSQSR